MYIHHGPVSKNKKLIELYYRCEENLKVNEHVDYTWSVISTALLLSENLWKNESVYKNISEDSVENIIDEFIKFVENDIA